jgi:hypothetical protein
MAMTNAERQARYRERQKARLANVAGRAGDAAWHDLLVDRYIAAGAHHLGEGPGKDGDGNLDPVFADALRRFLSRPRPTPAQMLEIVAEAGVRAAGADLDTEFSAWSRRQSELAAEEAARVAALPPSTPARRRRAPAAANG